MILDTNILIGYLNGEENIVKTINDWKRAGQVLFISSISVAETLALPNLTPKEINKIKAFLKNFLSIPFDDIIAERAALIKRIYNLTLPDSAIAATALSHNLPLVTRDQQFRKIQEITVVEI